MMATAIPMNASAIAALVIAALATSTFTSATLGQTGDNPVEIRAKSGERTVFRIPAELRDRVWPSFVSFGNTQDKKITFLLDSGTGEIVTMERAARNPVTHVEISSEHPWGSSVVMGWTIWAGHSPESLIRSDLFRGRYNSVFLALSSRRLIERRLYMIHPEIKGMVDSRVLVLIHDPRRDPGFVRASYVYCGERWCMLDGIYKGLFVKVSTIPRLLVDEPRGDGFVNLERGLKALLDSWTR